jgi:hypothetical protein
VTYHEVGRRELRLNWDALLADVADTPVESIQMHYMRVAPKRGHLGNLFPDGWVPARHDLLAAACAENRRYFRTWSRFESERLQLRKTAAGWECNEELSQQTGGLTYAEMLRVAKQAKFLTALRQMGDAVADLFEAVVARVPRLKQMPIDDRPTWSELTERWR